MRITPGDLDDPRVIGLLSAHLTSAQATTAAGNGGLRSQGLAMLPNQGLA